jgi:L-iditol 2-dehydrogenase
MRQGLLLEPGQLEVREVPIPVPRPGELIARVDLALTCGTDLKTYRRGHPLFPCPTPLGHEFTGTVARVGHGVTRFREGDPLLSVPSAPCGDCPACLRGDESLCDHIDGSTMAWGAFADYVRIPAHVVARNVFHRPRGLDLKRAALLEPLSCVVAGVERLDLTRTETAVVLGAGPMGQLFVSLLKLQGVPNVVVVGKRERRLRAARQMGADHVFDLAHVDGETAVRELVPSGACSVIECVGRPEAWLQAIAMVRKGGEVLLYGGCAAGTTVPVDAGRLHYDGLTLKGIFHFAPADVRIALDLIKSRRLALDGLFTGDYELAQLSDVFARLDQGDCLKLTVSPGGEA